MGINKNKTTKNSIDTRYKWGFYIAIFVILIFVPIVYQDNSRIMHILVMCVIWGLVSEAWNLILGFANVFSFAQLSFFAIGAYTSAMLTFYGGISPWYGLIAAGLSAALVGALIGLPCLKLKGIYVAIVTFSIHLVLPTIIVWGGQARFKYSTGGTFGLAGLRPFSIGSFSFGRNRLYWYFAGLSILFLTLFIIYKVINSYIGMAFIALRDSQEFAKSLGVNDYKYKIIVFSLSAFFTGIAGAFYVHYSSIVDPSILELDIFLLILVMVVLGGLGKFPGGVLGAFVITYTNEFLRFTGQYRYVILGLIVVITLTYLPGGIIGALEKLYFKVKNKSET